MHRICLNMPAAHAEAVRHFQRVANSSQNVLRVETLELPEAQRVLFDREVIPWRDEPVVSTKLFEIKTALGYGTEEPLILFTRARLVDEEDKEDWYFTWARTRSEAIPSVALISTHYLTTGILDQENDPSAAGLSLQQLILNAVVISLVALESHFETTGCIMDYCDDVTESILALRRGFVFCERAGCAKTLRSSEVGQAILQIADGLARRKYAPISALGMMSRCFKTGAAKCPRAPRTMPGQVFVGMPFRARYDDVYEYGIKPALENAGFVPWRGDEHGSLLDLMCKVCLAVQQSEAAIIDVSDQNPNVFFELGICYALGRPVLLIRNESASGKRKIPVDLRGIEYLPYSSGRELRGKLRTRLDGGF